MFRLLRTGGFYSNSSRRYATTNTMRIQNEPTYHVLGVPLRAGSLYPGSENDAQAFRDARLLQRLKASGLRVFDE
ncbi:MAG: hypothetical protein J2P52_13550, partial [Blastocatellia bacterium]|nr:hypothetical protein [Blastocatellia bacterium]